MHTTQFSSSVRSGVLVKSTGRGHQSAGRPSSAHRNVQVWCVNPHEAPTPRSPVQKRQGVACVARPKVHPVDDPPALLGSSHHLAPIQVGNLHADLQDLAERHDLCVVRFAPARLDFLATEIVRVEREASGGGEEERGEQVGVMPDVRRGEESESLWVSVQRGIG